MINILILSAGTRDKVVQYFKEALAGKGKVIATDCSPYAPAIYEADEYVLVPRITEPGYLDKILEICREKQITGVLSLIDPELSLLADNKERFLEVGTVPIVPDAKQVDICFHKYAMYEACKALGFATGRCFLDRKEFYHAVENGELTLPIQKNDVKTTGSVGTVTVVIKSTNYEDITLTVNVNATVEFLCSREDGLMIQEFMNGQEYGADVYIDMLSGEVVSIFVKKKLKMRAGETDKAESFQEEKLFALITDFVKKMGFRGIIDIDLFEIDGNWYISEVNPRFGGGYPHAWACGVRVPEMIVRNLEGQTNVPEIGNYPVGKIMMKYNEIMVR